jgi:Flp pilus assembly protein TadG
VTRKRHFIRGNIAMVFVLAAVPLALVSGVAVDLVMINQQKAALQAAADAGALAGARENTMAMRGQDGVLVTAVNVASNNMLGQSGGEQAQFTAAVGTAGNSVTVTGTIQHSSLFYGGNGTTIEVSATAQTLQQMPLCVLQTSDIASNGMKLADSARINAPGCVVHANTNIDVGSNAVLNAGTVQAAGAASGPIFPNPNVGAMVIADPFSGMDMTPSFKCPPNLPPIRYSGNIRVNLPPLTYCGEIIVNGNVELNFMPGEHYFMGSLDIRGSAKLVGDDVVLIFDNDDSFIMDENAEVRLRGRRSGRFAGFVIATSRNNDEKFVIRSTRVRELLGTIYIPSAELEIGGRSSVAEDSAWSVIVADTLSIIDSPTLVINRNYTASNVPVPKGVGPANDAPRLVE